MLFRQIHDPDLAQYAYLIGCQRTGEAFVIDPERDVDRYLAAAAAEGLTVTHVAETHIHADFLSGAQALAEATGAQLCLSAEGEDAGWGSEWAHGRDDVTFLRDGDAIQVGKIEVRAVHTPGHTPEHLSFLVTDHGGGADAPMGLVSGDFVFVGDLGRPDLLEQAAGQSGAQEAGARQLYQSVKRFLDLDDHVQVWPGHGAGSACGKALGAVPQTTVGYERRFNGAIDAARRGEAAFAETILDGQPEPPLYFARMKAQNRAGVPPLPALPQPAPLADLAGGLSGAVVIDTRPNRSAFMAAHLPGSLYAPLGPSFTTVVGSYVTDPEAPVVLVVPEAEVERAVRALVRIGIDRVVGTVTYERLAAHVQQGGETASIPESDFSAVRDREAVVVDVRRAAEVKAGHVPGSLHVPHTRLAARLDEVPRGRPLVVHCQSGARAAVASAFLASQGHDVTYVNERFARYRETGPVETGAPASLAV